MFHSQLSLLLLLLHRRDSISFSTTACLGNVKMHRIKKNGTTEIDSTISKSAPSVYLAFGPVIYRATYHGARNRIK